MRTSDTTKILLITPFSRAAEGLRIDGIEVHVDFDELAQCIAAELERVNEDRHDD